VNGRTLGDAVEVLLHNYDNPLLDGCYSPVIRVVASAVPFTARESRPSLEGEEATAMVDLVQKGAKLSILVARGEVTSAELLEAYKSFLDSSPTPLALLDLAAASLARIDAEGARALAERVMEMGKERWTRGKAAIVCGRKSDFGTARMFVMLLSRMGFPVRFAVFPGPHSAIAWLESTAGLPW
jgi:hypothetical protein